MTDARRPTNREQLANWFTYHETTPDQLPKYQAIRRAALAFAEVICDNAPDGPDQTVALRRVREAVMIANQSIACAPPA